MQDAFGVDAPPNGSEQDSDERQRRAQARPRSKRALPTDRMKWEVQLNALLAFAIASDNGKRAVTSDDIAPRIGVVVATAGLNNAFFKEAGLITQESKGRYKPTEAVLDFARKHSFDAAQAGRQLAPLLADTWFYREVQQQVAMGSPSVSQMVEVLAYAAGVMKDRQVQLAFLLRWLEYAGLVEEQGGRIVLTDLGTTEDGSSENDTGDNTPPVDPAPEGATTGGGQRGREQPAPEVKRAPAVLGFAFDFSLTAEDLTALSPEQIQAVFEAVGRVMAIKAGAGAT